MKKQPESNLHEAVAGLVQTFVKEGRLARTDRQGLQKEAFKGTVAIMKLHVHKGKKRGRGGKLKRKRGETRTGEGRR